MSGPQLVLDLGHRPAHGRADFLIARCNRAALGWLDRWPDWPAPGLVLYGPPGAGKSHLAAVWQARSGARLLEAASLDADSPARYRGPALVIEGLEALADERALLHLYNLATERGAHMLLTAQLPPARWPLALPDLASRMRALPAVALEAPDDALLAAVMIKLFADRQVEVGAALPAYLVARIERSLGAVRSLVAALDDAALAERRPITVPLARRVLDRLAAGAEP